MGFRGSLGLQCNIQGVLTIILNFYTATLLWVDLYLLVNGFNRLYRPYRAPSIKESDTVGL